MNRKNLQIVRVTWQDAHSHGIGWMDQEEFDEWMAEPGLMISVGLLIRKDKKWLAIAMSTGLDAVADCLKIPIGMVRKVESLGKVTVKDMALPPPGGKKRCKSSAPINSLSDRSSQ